tara:strand:- start:145 stop:321 length:177 start_codon:yes stop_codon:yes gene_type:complete
MEFLIATALTCSDISDQIQKVQINQTINAAIRKEIIDVYQTHLPEAYDIECTWDAKAD